MFAMAVVRRSAGRPPGDAQLRAHLAYWAAPRTGNDSHGALRLAIAMETS